MTKSTITRERLEWLSQISCRDDIEDIGGDEIRELASIALAAMDSEPVAEVVSIYGDPEAFGEREIRPLVGIQQMPYGTKLYRHAQPAPVVPEEATPDSIEILASARRRDHAVFQWDEDQRNAAADSWNAFRAAMLQELKKSAGTEAICRSDENVQVLHANPPVIPDGSASMLRRWLAFGRGMQNAGCQLPHNLIAESEAMLAAAPHDTPALNSVQSVVTVPDKWIPVSERMPENDVSVLTFDGMYKRVHHAMYGHWQCWEPEKITHWMPLPAASQEVKGE
ncbi:DUF551 domain-containing protein [Klebsiella pneumoniae]|uniref:DUF551 domain-containing protein n=1 Tax=Klebsiella pneumoniae TaxID=573 RepID=A0A483EJA9_KLEPN|nr:DUF551 domain-containing protein [Klebsiella pneumoniae]HDU4945508.1 DUF551 domain-containing protein [Klebsiella pneumoniae subsp. ozaenae]EIW8516272.1 DUF551 domain-containing protein [Klebsiella pneumoniae]EKV7609212.1 DUF551 domain-containing protein [Klebsiella pneumoniae]EKW8655329.1 DUF551 domain-containing protein [Klebsiella pneumoniae]EKZ6219325.1 DUF551 domain-containing protein [Klebsiella pneumoniae]